MKDLQLIIAIGLFYISSNGQDLTIPDYKGEKESLSKVKDKIIRREIASFTEAGSEEPKSNIELKKIPLIKFGTNYSTFGKDSILIKLTVGKFMKANHKIKYLGNYATKIDNKPIWGTDGELPKQQINSIYVKVGVDVIIIPRTAYQDLYEPSLSWKESDKIIGNLRIFRSKDKNRIYIAMPNSDGAGFYEATLIIMNGKYFGRVLDDGF